MFTLTIYAFVFRKCEQIVKEIDYYYYYYLFFYVIIIIIQTMYSDEFGLKYNLQW